jgi:hypothetical protein
MQSIKSNYNCQVIFSGEIRDQLFGLTTQKANCLFYSAIAAEHA